MITTKPSHTRKPAAPASKATSRQGYTNDHERWLALQERDPAADGQFVYAVATTGVYCRPVCPSRLALRANVAFYATVRDARLAGFRPCKRCQPDGPSQRERHAEIVAQACRVIEASESAPTLDAVAAAVGLSRYHFHRIFKSVLGITPRQYASARRTERMQSQLGSGSSVTNAIYRAGFNSSSRFYERSADSLGMTAGQFRGGGRGVAIRYAVAACPLGLVLVAGTARGICAVRFGKDRATLEQQLLADFPTATIDQSDDGFQVWVAAVVEHIERPASNVDVPLDIRGTAFQQRVWQALREIPCGHTASYSEIAARIGQPSAARAVARACATNPVALVVPCHRVLRKRGDLSGYHWGVDRKRQLLARESEL